MRNMWLAVAFCWCAMSAQAQVQINEVNPPQINLWPGGDQIHVNVHGNNLSSIRSAEAVTSDGKPDQSLYVQMSQPNSNRVSLSLLARQGAQIGSEHQIRFTLGNGKTLYLPVPIKIVAKGDPQATLPDPESQKKRAAVLAKQKPIVTATVPRPLFLNPNGERQTLSFTGKNLERIESLRIRRADQPVHYESDQGVLSFRRIPGGLQVDLVAAPDTPLGTKYCIDLLTDGNVLAGTLTFQVQTPEAMKAMPATAPAVNAKKATNARAGAAEQ